MRWALFLLFFSLSANNGFAQIVMGIRPPSPSVELKNTSDSGHCNKLKIIFKTPDADTVKISIREDSAGVPGKWHTNRSNPRAVDADYKGLKEHLDYDFQIEAINKYGKTLSPIFTRHSCH